jgi:hypothetical protein
MEYVVLWTAPACACTCIYTWTSAWALLLLQPAQQSHALLLTNQHALQTSFLDAFFPVGKSAFSQFDW